MPPPEEKPRPSDAEIAAVKAWIEAGAPAGAAVEPRTLLSTSDVYNHDPRRPRKDGSPRPPIPALLQPRASTQRRALGRGTADLSQRPQQAGQQPVVGLEDREPRSDRSREDGLSHRLALVRLGRDDLEPHPPGIPLRRPRGHHSGAGRDGRHADEGAGRPRRLVHRHREPRSALLRRTATPREPHRGGEATPRRCHPEHPAGARRARGLQRLGHLAVQPRSSNATTPPTACTGGATTSTSRPRTWSTA